MTRRRCDHSAARARAAHPLAAVRCVYPDQRQRRAALTSRFARAQGTAMHPRRRIGGSRIGGYWGIRTGRLAPRAGFEPATIRLTVECSTAELPRNRRTIVRERGAYNKAFRACKGPNGGSEPGIARKRKDAVLQGFAAGFSPLSDTICNAPAQCRHPRTSWAGRQIDSIRPEARWIAGFTGADSMPIIATDLIP